MSRQNAIPVGMCLPCSGPQFASGSPRKGAPAIAQSENDSIQPGQWVRFTHWPLGQDNPPRRVDGVNGRGICWLEPLPGWRTFARSMDLVLVTVEDLKAFVAAGGTLASLRDGHGDPPPAGDYTDDTAFWADWDHWASTSDCAETE